MEEPKDISHTHIRTCICNLCKTNMHTCIFVYVYLYCIDSTPEQLFFIFYGTRDVKDCCIALP